MDGQPSRPPHRALVERRQLALVLMLLSVLASCARPIRPPEALPELAPEPAADTRGAQVYTLDPTASKIHILVYRGGALARLGHNHVVTSRSVTGRAWLHPRFERSGFEMTIPVESLIVDHPDDRAAYGKDFPLGISRKDIEGTKRNMLRAEVLDAERFPTISLRSAEISGSVDAPVVTARISLKGVSKDVVVPIELAVSGRRLTASGAFDLLQTEFGMKPFSVALGALEVQDRLHLEFEIVAERAS